VLEGTERKHLQPVTALGLLKMELSLILEATRKPPDQEEEVAVDQQVQVYICYRVQ
jgi:hypothetical protein